LTFLLVAVIFTAYRFGWRGSLSFLLGSLADVPLLLLLWRFHPSEAIVQFLWHAGVQKQHIGPHFFLPLLHLLHWGAIWFLALLAFSIAAVFMALHLLKRRGTSLDEWQVQFALAAGFTLSALALLCRSTLMPYYLVYFSIWPLLGLVILVEKAAPRFRFAVAVMLLAWLPSAAWNLLRVREAIVYYPRLSKTFFFAELNKDVPHDQPIVASPDLYSVPIEAHYTHYAIMGTFPERLDTCPGCYLLMTLDEFNLANYVARSNLDQRKILYSGPAFPGAGMRDYRVVILSPEHSGA
jgi:hypothetical protein